MSTNPHQDRQSKPDEAKEKGSQKPSSEPELVIVDTQGNPFPHAGNSYKELTKLAKRFLKQIPHGERMMILLTFVVALATISQAVIAWYSNRTTGRIQTDQFNQMKSVADRMEGAANSFAGNSANINQSIAVATTKLQTQADTMDAARKTSEANSKAALQATIDNFHQDQRAWVGIDSWLLAKFAIGSPVVVKVRFTNRGRTPAFDVMGGGTGGRIVSNDHTPAQVEDILREEFGKIALKSQTPISPQNGLELIAAEKNDLDAGRFNAVSSGISTWYMVGKITYKDAFRQDQWLTYCLRMAFSENTPYLLYCDKDNDMSGSSK